MDVSVGWKTVKVNSKLQSKIDRFSDASDSRLRYVIFYHQFLKINLGRTLSVYLSADMLVVPHVRLGVHSRENVRGTLNNEKIQKS